MVTTNIDTIATIIVASNNVTTNNDREWLILSHVRVQYETNKEQKSMFSMYSIQKKSKRKPGEIQEWKGKTYVCMYVYNQ